MLSIPFRASWRSLRLLLAGLLLPGLVAAQSSSLLQDDPATEVSPLANALRHARALTLDAAAARTTLKAAPAEGQPGLEVALPLPDGTTGRFRITQAPVMAPTLAAHYPAIQTYSGVGLDDPTATVRLDLTPAGFHAQVLSARTGAFYIDPARRGDATHYLSFWKRDMLPGAAGPVPVCGFRPTKADRAAMARNRAAAAAMSPAMLSAGGALRTYRLALACTGEYAAFHGGTKASALAAMVTSVNRVVGVYERELAVRLVLVPTDTALIYLDPATDPYSNDDGGAMLGENQLNVDALIGPANYDIGHVFSTGGGGVAGYAVVCTGSKAEGVTGSGAPVGDAFDIDYVAHEMGHQFSGSHPFNSTAGACGGGNRVPEAAWEVGSGITIMAYAGICGADDLAAHSVPFFHVGNFEEMRPFIVQTPCAVVTLTGNTTPVVTGPTSGKVLPIRTPFKLTANATDADGDTLTYDWEEYDRGPAGPVITSSTTQTPNATPPLFRSFPPVASPKRYFPRLPDLVNNTTTFGEALPTVARKLTFKCTARDEHAGLAGVVGGVTSSDSVKLTVTSAAGPFLVTAPNTAAVTWTGGSTQTVTWDVAGTTANGVNCATVNVRLSLDGGLTYPTTLALGVANSGTTSITVPSVSSTTARVMVEAADNYFFDISNANFTISSATVCAAPTTPVVSAVATASATVSFTPSPTAVSYVVTTTPATTPQTITASPVQLTGLTPGTTYTVSIQGNCAGGSTSDAATVAFTTLPLPTCGTPTELGANPRTPTSATINFIGTALGTSYTVTTVPATSTQTVSGSPVQLTGLTPATTYTVSIVSNCGATGTSPAATFTFNTPALPPANDLCANAIPLSCGATVTGTTDGATTPGDPAMLCVEPVDEGGVFYTLVTGGGRTTVSMCGNTTDYDSKLFVFQGPCGGPYTCLTGNDDACDYASRVSFTAISGATYLVMVSGYGTETGRFSLTVTCTAPTGLATEATPPAFTVWPNPAGAKAAFHVSLAMPAPAATVVLADVLGRRVTERAFSGTDTEVPTTGLAPGTYLLTVQVAGQAPVVRRVVVE